MKSAADATELEDAIEIAKRNRWRRGTMQKHLKYSTDRRDFFEKCKAAALEGYAIIPDLPCDVFAIRVDPDCGVARSHDDQANPNWLSLPDQPADKLEVGEGEYKNPQPTYASGSYDKTLKDGKQEKRYWRDASDFQDVVFPVIAAKPKIMEATQEAMVKKIFDEVAIVPSRPRRRKDPMIVGRVLGPEDTVLNFVICWFLDLKAMER